MFDFSGSIIEFFTLSSSLFGIYFHMWRKERLSFCYCCPNISAAYQSPVSQSPSLPERFELWPLSYTTSPRVAGWVLDVVVCSIGLFLSVPFPHCFNERGFVIFTDIWEGWFHFHCSPTDADTLIFYMDLSIKLFSYRNKTCLGFLLGSYKFMYRLAESWHLNDVETFWPWIRDICLFVQVYFCVFFLGVYYSFLYIGCQHFLLGLALSILSFLLLL